MALSRVRMPVLRESFMHFALIFYKKIFVLVITKLKDIRYTVPVLLPIIAQLVNPPSLRGNPKLGCMPSDSTRNVW